MVLQTAILAAGLNFASGFLKGKEAENEYLARAETARQQAAVYRQNAATVRLNGALNEDAQRSQKRATIASARAAAGEAGMGESPTTATALATTSSALEQNILNRRYETESAAENYLYQARLAEEEARQYKKTGSNMFVSNMLSGLASAVGGFYKPNWL